jgi:hypothetical protein
MSGRSFDPIGPFSLRRWDLIVASLQISFLVAPWWFRLIFGLIYLLLAAALVIGAMTGSGPLIGAATALLVLMVFSPAMRTVKDLTNITVRPSPEGIEVENNRASTNCKWPTLKRTRATARFVYVPISIRVAFAVPRTATTPENLAALVAYVEAGVGGELSTMDLLHKDGRQNSNA